MNTTAAISATKHATPVNELAAKVARDSLTTQALVNVMPFPLKLLLLHAMRIQLMPTAIKHFISIVIPTLNSEATLSQCLQAIRDQTYASDQYEVVIADAGSQDGTLDIAKQFHVEKVVENPLKTGEAGKTAGIKAATGDIVVLIDSDNIISDKEWLNKMIAPFVDPDLVASEPLVYSHRKEDPAFTRYCAMLGMNDPICLFLGNYDRECMITGRWTGLDVKQEDCGSYLKLTLTEAQLPTIGANGFAFRRALLEHVNWDPYFFDIDIVHQAVAAGFKHIAKVKCGIVHLYCSRLHDFYRKQDRRIKDFLFFSQQKGRTYPWRKQQRRGIVSFCIYTVLVIPLAFQMLRGFRRKPDAAWLYHIPVCWITLWVYGSNMIRKSLGITPKLKSRATWQA